MELSFEEKVFLAARRIPRGRVSTYFAIARAVGKPGAARAVGNALNKNPYKIVPCYRVIRSDGTVGGYARGNSEKIKVLRGEGIKVERGRVSARFILRRL
jgi:methylated-DNA-[protein]-cysteine S-methyltransferase